MKIKYDYKDVINNITLLNNNNESEHSSFLSNYWNRQTTILDENGNLPQWLQNISKIAYMAFEMYPLDIMVLPNSVTSIGDDAFMASKLKSITIPDSVTRIGNRAFSHCSQLTDMYLYPTTPPTLDNDYSIVKTTTIHVPIGSGDAYKSATNWSNYADKIVEDIMIE